MAIFGKLVRTWKYILMCIECIIENVVVIVVLSRIYYHQNYIHMKSLVMDDVKIAESKSLVLYSSFVVYCFIWLHFFLKHTSVYLNCKGYTNISSFPGKKHETIK